MAEMNNQGLASGNTLASPTYDTGWINRFKNTYYGTGPRAEGLTPNQGLATQAYGNLNDQLASGSITPGQYEAGITTLNQGTTAATDAGAFGTVGEGVSNVGSQASGLMGGASSLMSIASGINNIINGKKALSLARDQHNRENARADEIMAMNREKYNTFKADKARLGASYGGN